MTELMIVAAICAAFLFGGVALMIPWETALPVGVALMATGSVVGIPTGFVYHVILYRALRAHGELERRWIWSPMDFHHRVPREALRPALPWFYVGGASCGLIFLGCGVIGLAMLAEIVRT